MIKTVFYFIGVCDEFPNKFFYSYTLDDEHHCRRFKEFDELLSNLDDVAYLIRCNYGYDAQYCFSNDAMLALNSYRLQATYEV